MAFHIKTQSRATNNNRDGTVYILEDPKRKCFAEFWPAEGFNCLRWTTLCCGKPHDWLYSSPQVMTEQCPTRSGNPILFPFPNRIRGGVFSWDGQEYHLEKNDPEGANAIHGFACHYSWRIVGSDITNEEASISAEFQASIDAPDAMPLWPADYKLQATYRISAGTMGLTITISNPDTKPLPCGIGFHPFFTIPKAEDQTLIHVPATQCWPLAGCLPDGEPQSIDADKELVQSRLFQDLKLDDVFTELVSPVDENDGLRLCGSVSDVGGQYTLQLRASTDFREVVVFTPPHRQAICLEPYTCPTDAVNIHQKGTDVGWRVLEPGESWTVTIAMTVPTK
ncbi:MAG: aldose 1-epimerase [Gemmataceae bacterium]